MGVQTCALPILKSTLQLELVVPGTRTQGLTVAVDPDGWLVKLKSTVPVGGVLVPLAVSLTVTVQPSGLLAGVVARSDGHTPVPRARSHLVCRPLLAESTDKAESPALMG